MTITFTHTVAVGFLAQEGNADGLKNGLSENHFVPLKGDLAHCEYQTPSQANIIRELLTVDDFKVNSYQFQFRNKRFFVNQIGDKKNVLSESGTIKLPKSAKKIAIALGAGSLVLATICAGAWLGIVLL